MEQYHEVKAKSFDFKTPGRGQRNTPVLCTRGAVELILVLPGRRAAHVRRRAELLGPTALGALCSGSLARHGADRLFNIKSVFPLFRVNLRYQQPPPKYCTKTLAIFCRILAAFAPVKSRTICTTPSMVVTGVFLFGSIRPLASGKLTGSQFVSRSPSELLVRYLGGPAPR